MSANQESFDALKFWTVIAATIAVCVVVGRTVTEYPPVFMLVMAAGLCVALVSFVYPKVGIDIVVFSMILSPKIAGPSMLVVKANDFLLAVILLAWVARTAIFRNSAFLIRNPLNLPIFALTAVYVFSTVLGLMRGNLYSVEKAFFYVLKYVEYFLLFFMTVNVVETRDDARRYLKYGFITAIIATIFCWTQVGTGQRVALPFDTALGDRNTGNEANTCGGYYLVVFGLLMGIYTQLLGTEPLVAIGSFLFMLAPFLMTQSRSSYGGFAAAMAFHVFSTRKRRLALVFGMGAGLFLMFLVPTIRKTVVDRVAFTFSGESGETENIGGAKIKLEGSAAARLQSWRYILQERFPVRPIIGWGVSGVGLVDVYYPRVLGETGIIGLLFFFWLIFRIFSCGWRVFRESEESFDKAVALGVMTALVGLLIQSFGANTFIIVRIMEPFWFATALLARMYWSLEAGQDLNLEPA